MHARLLARLYIDAWILAGIVWAVAALSTKPAERTEPLSSRLTQLGWSLVSIVLLSFPRLPWGPLGLRVIPRSWVLGLAGLAMTVGGIALAFWARFFLGRNWSARVTIKQDHELIRSGPYSVVRHPIYTGFIVALTGTVIAIGEIRAILALAIVVVGLHFKSKREEQFMLDRFGDQYASYQREVNSMIPWVWWRKL